MNTNKVEELINVIDPDKYQCYKCKKWRDKKDMARTINNNVISMLCKICHHRAINKKYH